MVIKLPVDAVMETEADLRAMRGIVDGLEYFKSRKTAKERAAAPVPTKQAGGSNSPIGKKSVEHFYLAALEALGGAATGEEMYQKFLELGFKTGARNQKDAIKTYFRQRGKFAPLPPDEHGVVRWTLKEQTE